jgi:hypothetical protein
MSEVFEEDFNDDYQNPDFADRDSHGSPYDDLDDGYWDLDELGIDPEELYGLE